MCPSSNRTTGRLPWLGTTPRQPAPHCPHGPHNACASQGTPSQSIRKPVTVIHMSQLTIARRRNSLGISAHCSASRGMLPAMRRAYRFHLLTPGCARYAHVPYATCVESPYRQSAIFALCLYHRRASPTLLEPVSTGAGTARLRRVSLLCRLPRTRPACA